MKRQMDHLAKLAELRELSIVMEALQFLSQNLPRRLCYHSLAHTEDVLSEAVLFGVEDGLAERELELLAIAAVYHDAGYCRGELEHERIGARMAEAAMSKAGGYLRDEKALVKSAIEDTAFKVLNGKRVRVATTLLSRYLIDADWSNLGRPDFFDKMNLVRLEVQVGSSDNFEEEILTMLKTHKWLTPAAKKLRSAQWRSNLNKLKKITRT